MQRFFGTAMWRWLANLLFLVFFAIAALRGDYVYAFGWLAFLVAGIVVASGAAARSRTVAYLAGGLLVLGVVLLVTGLILAFSG